MGRSFRASPTGGLPVIGLVVWLLCSSCGATAPSRPPAETNPAGSTSTRPITLSRVAVVVMENREYDQVIGNPEAPFINELARRYALATSYFAVSHPSLPNYLALIGGSTFGIHSDCTTCHVAGTNLADQLEGAGISWKAYMQGLPAPCFTGASAGRYEKKHDPFVYFDDIAEDPGRCSRVVPLTQLSIDVRTGRVPRFLWVTPDGCNDGHDCGTDQADRFLSGLVPELLSVLGPAGVLFVTWDEGTTSRGAGVQGGGQVATIAAGPAARRGERSGQRFTHYSLLRTIESAWRLPLLRQAGCTCTEPLAVLLRA